MHDDSLDRLNNAKEPSPQRSAKEMELPIRFSINVHSDNRLRCAEGGLGPGACWV